MRLAADLLIEAEHGTDTSVVLVDHASAGLADRDRRRVGAAARRAARARGPRRRARRSARTAAACIVDSLDDAVAVANRYAPEHLQVAVADADVDARRRPLVNAGEILDRPAHAVQRGQLRDRLPRLACRRAGSRTCRSGITADAFLKRTAIARADAARARTARPVRRRPRRPRRIPRPRRRNSPAPRMNSANYVITPRVPLHLLWNRVAAWQRSC